MAEAPRTRGNLPAELTSFVGRREELAATRRLLSAARLVTLTGAGGVGKTRLALRAATVLRRAFPDGVWFVRLADVTEPSLLPVAITAELGPAAREAGLSEHLRDKRLLLVLDNCEQVVHACAVLAAKLLSAAPELRILVTSRQILRADGEQVLVVPPLPPDGDAVALFTERAAAVPGCRLGDGDREAVRRICRRLDGIPLALELAAARLRVLSPEQLLHRLDDRFRLLTTGKRTDPPRTQTLEAAVAWSFELCTPREQEVWAATSVLPGGFDLEAAEAVCAFDAGEVLDLVAALVDKSVLSRRTGTYGRSAWYEMLGTFREYGRIRLAGSGQEDAVLDRRLAHYAGLAREFGQSFGPAQRDWLERLCREQQNLSAVAADVRALPIVTALRDFWAVAAPGEGRRLLAASLDHASGPLRARALEAAAFLALWEGAAEAARPLLGELRALLAEHGDRRLHAGYAQCSGLARLWSGDLASARARLGRALAAYRGLGDEAQVCTTLVLLAVVDLLDGRSGAAADHALALCEARQADWSRGYALWAVAITEWRRGGGRRAETLLRQAISLRLPDRALLALAVSALAWCAEADNLPERAAGLLGAAHALRRESGERLLAELDERCAERLRRSLGAKAFTSAFDAAARAGTGEAIALALRERKEPVPAGPRPGGLTRREREIAGLVADGLSNRDIAARLVIAQRTAETHVEHILAKLGFSSRAQIAAWLAAGDGSTYPAP
ncbi:ATP-binding protein [Amycolatopsis sacchari]|uniref:ATP-binding protein n=2 Tax=Amycolatopsis sacchari TaxID=115433 RepID=UPI003EB77662